MRNKLKIPVGPVFKKTLAAGATTVVNAGGARSGKSYAAAQLLIMKAQNEPLSIAITRKTMPALKMTAQKLFIELLQKYGLYKTADYNRTENYYILGKSRVQFFPLDDPEKIKSSEFNYIWMEEANEFTFNDYLVLLTRLSAPRAAGGKNQIFLTLNPVDGNCWIARKLLPRPDAEFINSTYKDNKFLAADYIETLLSLKEHDTNAYNIFALGKWGGGQKHVYTNWAAHDGPLQNADDIIWGLDFGFNNPTALVKIYIKDGVYCAHEALYQIGLNNSALVEKLREIIPPSERAQPIYADAAEPARISEIANAGFNIKPALKAVQSGILAVKAAKLGITKDSPNLIKEIQNYTWQTDKNGNTLEEPVKFNDHALDALRYAIYTHTTQMAKSSAADISFF